MIIVLSGADSYRSRERLKQLREAFIKKYDPSGMNVRHFEAGAFTFEDFDGAATSQGFLSSRRFIIIENPLQLDLKIQKQIAEAVIAKKVPAESIVVFWIGDEPVKKPRKSVKVKAESAGPPLAAILQAADTRELFDVLTPTEVERWIEKFVQQHKGTIDRAAVAHLAAAVGSDLWLASNELTKLLHQQSGRIDLAAAQASMAAKEEENIFAFTDALSRKAGPQALQLLEQQLDSGANAIYLVSMLMRQVRILLSVGDVMSAEPNPATIATRLKLHPFVVQKSLQQVKKFSQSELLAAHAALVEIDRKLKSTRENPRALLELFVLQTCRR